MCVCVDVALEDRAGDDRDHLRTRPPIGEWAAAVPLRRYPPEAGPGPKAEHKALHRGSEVPGVRCKAKQQQDKEQQKCRQQQNRIELKQDTLHITILITTRSARDSVRHFLARGSVRHFLRYPVCFPEGEPQDFRF
jgi:hypothetical protein